MVSVGRVPAFRSPKLKIKNMKHLEELAKEYAQKNFPISEGSNSNIIKHDVAYHSFCDGFNEGMRILMGIGNIKSLDKRIVEFNFIEVEEKL